MNCQIQSLLVAVDGKKARMRSEDQPSYHQSLDIRRKPFLLEVHLQLRREDGCWQFRQHHIYIGGFRLAMTTLNLFRRSIINGEKNGVRLGVAFGPFLAAGSRTELLTSRTSGNTYLNSITSTY